MGNYLYCSTVLPVFPDALGSYVKERTTRLQKQVARSLGFANRTALGIPGNVCKTVSVPAVMSAGTVSVYIEGALSSILRRPKPPSDGGGGICVSK